MQFLQANTQTVVRIGPFLDVTDKITPETGVTLTGGGDNADEAELLKAAGAATVDISSNTWAAITGCDGWYNLTLTALNLDTEGLLTVVIQNDSVHVPVYAHFMVLAQAAYISLFTAKDTGYMDTNVKAVSEDTTAADNLETACDNYSATRGLSGTALPAAAADAAGGLPISDAGGLDMDAILADTNELQTDLVNGGRLDLLIDAIKAKTDNLPSSVPKNTALSNFGFAMFSSIDHVTPTAGLTVSGYVSADGADFAALTNSVTAIGNGVYKVDLEQTEMNADVVILRFTASGADDTIIVIKTDS